LDLGEGIAIAGLGYAMSACLLIWTFGIQTTLYFVLLGTCIGILLMHLTIIRIKIPGIEEWLRNVGREGENPGEGALYNALGILFVLSLLRYDSAAAISVILILALGDGFATYIGTRYGRHRLHLNAR
jgi:dolichol kinase